jgi:four helix bundle protein
MTENSKRQTANSKTDPFGGAYTFRTLAMWQRAQELTNDVLDVVANLPGDRASLIIAQQIVKSSSSVAANIAEGHGRYALGAYRNHLSIARGSTAETISWIDLLRRRGLISEAFETAMLQKCAELMKMLTAKMVQMAKGPASGRTLREDLLEYEVE